MSGDGVFASLRKANKARQDAWNAPPVDEPAVALAATFKTQLPPTTVTDRWALAGFLEETALRTSPGAHRGDNVPDWVRALVGVIRDLATAARDAHGSQVASAQEATSVTTSVTLRVKVPLNREARIKLHNVLKVAAWRANGSEVNATVSRIQADFETFTYGPKGEPEEQPRRRHEEPPGMWTPIQ